MKKATIILGWIQALVAIGAIPAGLSVIIDPSGSAIGAPIEMLQYSPFQNFLIPGIFLLTFNGIFHAIGAWSSLTRKSFAGNLGLWLGLILITWIIVQVYFLRSIHYLHVLYLVVGGIETVLAYKINQVFKSK